MARRRRRPDPQKRAGKPALPSADEVAQLLAEGGRQRAVRHELPHGHRVMCTSMGHVEDDFLTGKPYWSISLTGKQARWLYAAFIAGLGRYEHYVALLQGTLPKTGLRWWYESDQRLAYLCVGSWTQAYLQEQRKADAERFQVEHL